MLKLLVEHGANSTPAPGLPDPLTLAARNADIDAMRVLVARKPYNGGTRPPRSRARLARIALPASA